MFLLFLYMRDMEWPPLSEPPYSPMTAQMPFNVKEPVRED